MRASCWSAPSSQAKAWGRRHRRDHAFETLPEDIDHFEPILAGAIKRVPFLETAGIALFFNGPESFTPDDRYYLGEAPEVKNSTWPPASTRSAPVVGRGGPRSVEWIKNGHPPMDVNGVDIRRIHPFQSVRYVRDRARKPRPPLCHALAVPPGGDGARRPALADPRQEGARRVFGEVNGWERPNWYAPRGRARIRIFIRAAELVSLCRCRSQAG